MCVSVFTRLYSVDYCLYLWSDRQLYPCQDWLLWNLNW